MYHVRFIKNWKGSRLTPQDWSASPLLYGQQATITDQIQDEIEKDSAEINDRNIIVNSKSWTGGGTH